MDRRGTSSRKGLEVMIRQSEPSAPSPSAQADIDMTLGQVGPRGAGPPAGPSDPPADRPPSRRIPPRLYRIGEVVEYSGVSRQTIHNYTVAGLLRESNWTKGGHRLYGEDVFARLDRIVQLKSQSKSLLQIRRHLDADESAATT